MTPSRFWMIAGCQKGKLFNTFNYVPQTRLSLQLGYEILPNKYFYRYEPPKPAKDLLAEFWRLEKEAEKMLEGLA